MSFKSTVKFPTTSLPLHTMFVCSAGVTLTLTSISAFVGEVTSALLSIPGEINHLFWFNHQLSGFVQLGKTAGATRFAVYWYYSCRTLLCSRLSWGSCSKSRAGDIAKENLTPLKVLRMRSVRSISIQLRLNFDLIFILTPSTRTSSLSLYCIWPRP